MLTTNDDLIYLKKVHEYLKTFIDITDEEFVRIAKVLQVKHFPKKHKIVDINEVSDHFYIILKGVARKYIVAGKKEVTCQIALEGEFIASEISFINRTPSAIIIQTLEPTIAISIQHREVEQLYIDMPKIEKLSRLIFTQFFIKKDQEDFNNLEKTTQERFLEYVKTYPHMLQRVPQKYIASYLNIKPETFSRLKHLLRKRPDNG